MYKIYLDKDKIFECSIKIDGARFEKSRVFLVLEGPDFQIRFKGEIKNRGIVSIPIKKLKNILDENFSGKMFLEVIAEDIYFTPYTADYITEIHTKVEATVKDYSIAKKPEASVIIKEPQKHNSAKDLAKFINSGGINLYNIGIKKQLFSKLLEEYLTKNKVSIKESKEMIDDLPEALSQIYDK